MRVSTSALASILVLSAKTSVLVLLLTSRVFYVYGLSTNHQLYQTQKTVTAKQYNAPMCTDVHSVNEDYFTAFIKKIKGREELITLLAGRACKISFNNNHMYSNSSKVVHTRNGVTV